MRLNSHRGWWLGSAACAALLCGLSLAGCGEDTQDTPDAANQDGGLSADASQGDSGAIGDAGADAQGTGDAGDDAATTPDAQAPTANCVRKDIQSVSNLASRAVDFAYDAEGGTHIVFGQVASTGPYYSYRAPGSEDFSPSVQVTTDSATELSMSIVDGAPRVLLLRRSNADAQLFELNGSTWNQLDYQLPLQGLLAEEVTSRVDTDGDYQAAVAYKSNDRLLLLHLRAGQTSWGEPTELAPFAKDLAVAIAADGTLLVGYTDAAGTMFVYRRSKAGVVTTTPVPQAEGSFNFALTLEAGEVSTLFVESGSWSFLRGGTLQPVITASSAYTSPRLELGTDGIYRALVHVPSSLRSDARLLLRDSSGWRTLYELGAETAQLRITPSGGSAMLVNAAGQGAGASHQLRLVECE